MSQIDSKIIRKSTKMCPKSVYEALGEGLGGILGGLWGGLGAKSAPRWFQDPQSESFDPLLAAILEAKIDENVAQIGPRGSRRGSWGYPGRPLGRPGGQVGSKMVLRPQK